MPKISALPPQTVANQSDLVCFVDESGTPTTRRLTVGNLFARPAGAFISFGTTPATAGEIRMAFAQRALSKSSGNYDAGVDLTIWETYDQGAPVGARDTLTIGSDKNGSNSSLFECTQVWARTLLNFGVGVFPYPVQVILEDIGGGLPGQWHCFGSNVVIGGGDSNIGAGKNAIIFFDATLPTANPAAGSKAFYETGNRFKTLTSAGVTDFVVERDSADTLTNKTISATDNSITDAGAAVADILAISAGTKFTRFAKGTANQVLAMNGTGTALAWTTPSSGPSTPTGIGFWHNTVAGVLDATAKKVDTTASADVTVPATANGVVRVSGSALANDSGFTHDGAGRATLSAGATFKASPATLGTLRFANASDAYARDVAGAADLCIFEADTSNVLWIGGDSSQGHEFTAVNIQGKTGNHVSIVVGTSTFLRQTESATLITKPILGFSSPYGAHGDVVVAVPNGGTTTLSSSEYDHNLIQVGTAIGAGTSGNAAGNLDFFTPGAGNGYEKTVYNGGNSGTPTIRKAGGGGTTATGPISGRSAKFFISSGGAARITADQISP